MCVCLERESVVAVIGRICLRQVRIIAGRVDGSGFIRQRECQREMSVVYYEVIRAETAVVFQ